MTGVLLNRYRIIDSIRCFLALCLFAAGLSLLPGPVRAQSAASGTIEGRVFNPGNGTYLENARITIEGTQLEAFTDSGGLYRFTDVPAGAVKIRAFFTGLDVQTKVVTVAPGGTVQHDISLNAFQDSAGKDAGPVTLAQYVVTESQQMEGAAIAINEQRFAPNLKTVVAADEFGAASEGDVGEFLKYLPGVSMDYLAGDARQVSLGGVDFNYTPVTFGGFGMTNGNQGGTNRGVSLEYVSLNNVSRVEVINSPTPESPGAALAGSINFVPRTAFERSKPLVTFSAYVTMRDDVRDFHRSIGPRDERTRKVLPGVEFSYVVPVNRRFGFSLSGTASKSYSARDSLLNTWRGGNAVTNGGTFPDTTPDQPYLSGYVVRDGFLIRKRSSLAMTFDYKPGRNHSISFSITRSTYNTNYDIRGLTFAIERVLPGNFSPAFTRGAAAMGSLNVSTEVRDRNTLTYMPSLVYRHDGPAWKAEAGAGFSHSKDSTQSGDRGWFAIVNARRTGVTVAFDDRTRLRPGRITVTDGAAPVDPFDIRSYVLQNASLAIPQNSDTKRSIYANLRRDFEWRGLPIALKGGLDLQNAIRDDTRGVKPANVLYDFIGQDGRTSTAPAGSDDLAAPFFYTAIAGRPGKFGFPPIPVVSNARLWDDFKANPAHFRADDNATYRSAVTPSKRAEETVSSVYLRGDVQLFNRRLKLVGGLRTEQTNIDAEGPLSDPTRNYQRDAAGNVILGANRRPLPIATDALSVSKLTFISRGAHVEKEYLRWFPSLNASFNVRENLMARAAHYTSIGRPNFNQYSGGITLPDTEADPSSSNRIVVNNAGIKPWSARSTNVALEYYFARVGLLSLSAFRRDFENFFGTSVLAATPEFLALYSLDPATYGDYLVSTQYNLVDTVRMEGFSFNYKQALTFLPSWARGVQVFANGSTQHASGAATGEFQYSPRLANAGISLTRQNYSVRVDVNHRGRQSVNTLSGRGIQAGTTRWACPRTSIDITGEHALGRGFRIFAKLRNVTDVGVDFEFYGPATPEVARFQQRERYGALWTFGLKGSF
ncbi:MAG: carboxypeptidase regulatory-like domain-containing protein [Verrucomicrobia bacterium]|nr:carboxypeptidase regulatory-like domain-containing protein [Verrucomicrobiota bacterium]